MKTIGPDSPMSAVLEVYPGAQRALFRQYHIGGCNNCGFRPDETLADVCARNGGLIVAEVLENIRASHEQDERVLIAPADLAAWLQREPGLRLVDIRSREEFEAVHIKGSELLSQEAMRRIMSDGSNDRPLVIIDHRGAQSLDAAAYFAGHGLRSVRCLRGGIDAWSREVDPKLPRYQYAVQPAAA